MLSRRHQGFYRDVIKLGESSLELSAEFLFASPSIPMSFSPFCQQALWSGTGFV